MMRPILSGVWPLAKNLIEYGTISWMSSPHYVDQTSNHRQRETVPRSAVGNVSGYRCVSDCRSRGREFDPGPVPYFRGD